MLSISTKSGSSVSDAAAVANYPDEHKDKEKQVGSIEDYYSQGSDKTPSAWIGGAASELGLSGTVNREDHIKTLMGFDPKTGEALVKGVGEERRYAWDLTFSAPKSVSIAWAIGSENTRSGVEIAQQRAVGKVLSFMEEKFELGRRGQGGLDREKVKLLAAAFLHGSSREQDPQIHTHLMLQNMAQRADGTWGALEPKKLFEWKMALGALYRAELAKGLNEIGFQIESGGDSFRITGVPKELEEEFSKRRQQIEKSLAESGFSGGKASEMAALNTRKGKEILDSEVLKSDWKARAQAHGVTREAIESFRTEQQKTLVPLDRAALLPKMTAMESVFQEKDFFQKVAVEMSHQGKGLSDIEEGIALLKKDPELVKLHGKDGKTYYTTRELLTLERAIVENAVSGKAAPSEVSHEAVHSAIVQYEFRKGFALSDEQKNAIVHVTVDPGSVVLVRGWAGAGKTTALEVAKDAWTGQCFEVIGCALSGKAAGSLQKEAGIQSQTIHSLISEVAGYTREDGTFIPPTRIFTDRSIVVMDEAGMVDSRTWARLDAVISSSGAKLVAVGDDKQLAPVQAGAPFRTLVKNLGAAELTENRRQKSFDEKDASRHLRFGEVKESFTAYLDKNALSVAETRDAGIALTLDKWKTAYNPEKHDSAIMGATTRAEVADLNRLAREHLKAFGVLSGESLFIDTTDRTGGSAGKIEIMTGDRIMFKSGDKRLGIKNGMTGTLEKIEGKTLTIALDSGGKGLIDTDRYKSLKHAYSMTAHELQGMTVDKTVVLLTGRFNNKELTYVLGTRHREGMELVLTAPAIEQAAGEAGIALEIGSLLDQVKALIGKMEVSQEKASSLDFEVEEEIKEEVKEKEKEVQKPDKEIPVERNSGRERSREREFSR